MFHVSGFFHVDKGHGPPTCFTEELPKETVAASVVGLHGNMIMPHKVLSASSCASGASMSTTPGLLQVQLLLKVFFDLGDLVENDLLNFLFLSTKVAKSSIVNTF